MTRASSNSHDAARLVMTTAAWRILTLAVDTYRFINISGECADDVIVSAATPAVAAEGHCDRARDIAIDGPVDHVLGAATSPYYFDRSLAPGQYSLHWQPEADSGARLRTATFALPPSGVDFGTLLHREADAAACDDEAEA